MNIDAVNTERIQTQTRDSGTEVEQAKIEQQQQEMQRQAKAIQMHRNETKENQKSQELDMEKTIKDIETLSKQMNKKIKFTMDYEHNEMVVRIVDKDTREVIRQLPTEEMRRLHQKLQETAEMLGLIVDATA